VVGKAYAIQSCGDSHDAQPSACRNVTSAPFFCHGKAYHLLRRPGLLLGSAEAIPSPLMGERERSVWSFSTDEHKRETVNRACAGIGRGKLMGKTLWARACVDAEMIGGGGLTARR
jgi:hypothetical protein